MYDDNKILDDVRKQLWPKRSILSCPWPAMINHYGHDGQCTVSMYTCYNCKYVKHYPFTGAISCGYEGRETK